jgi:hypothetical protein
MEIPTTHVEQQSEKADPEPARKPGTRAARKERNDVLARRQQEGKQWRCD